MRFCPNCGVKVFDDEAKFCIECGSSLTAKSVTSTQSNISNANKSISVKRGQKADLTKNNPNLKNIVVKLSWQSGENFDLDAAAFLLKQIRAKSKMRPISFIITTLNIPLTALNIKVLIKILSSLKLTSQRFQLK